MEKSPRLSLNYVLPQQAQKHVSVNETFRRLDVLVQASVLSASIAVEPADQKEGDCYLLPEGKSGAVWSLFRDHSLTLYQDGDWREFAAETGWRVFIADRSQLVVFNGARWTGVGGDVDTIDQLGVNADADSVNRLLVKSDAELLTHDDVTPGSGDERKIINRKSVNKTASLVFQTGFSGRAEIGLIGDENLRVKTSSDGNQFSDALVVNVDNGNVGIGRSPMTKLDVGGPVRCKSYVLTETPLAAEVGAGAIIFISDETNGATLAYSDGAAWRRVADQEIVS